MTLTWMHSNFLLFWATPRVELGVPTEIWAGRVEQVCITFFTLDTPEPPSLVCAAVTSQCQQPVSLQPLDSYLLVHRMVCGCVPSPHTHRQLALLWISVKTWRLWLCHSTFPISSNGMASISWETHASCTIIPVTVHPAAAGVLDHVTSNLWMTEGLSTNSPCFAWKNL